jgi:hypothetical protein
MADEETLWRPPNYPARVYQRSTKKISQGDIALCEFHQLRAKSGSEPPGPGPQSKAGPQVPYLGPYQDIDVPIPPFGEDEDDGGQPVTRVLRVWLGYGMVLHQNCELDQSSEADSRLLVAPIVFRANWPTGLWSEIRKNNLPGYLYLPRAAVGELTDAPLDEWHESAVVFASATLLGKGLVRPNRQLALTYDMLPHLQKAVVRYSSVRGWATHAVAEGLVGKTIIGVEETAETVRAPARLSKVFLRDGDDGDETTVVLGLRQPAKSR